MPLARQTPDQPVDLLQTALIVLAAGRSQRMGTCKALVEFKGRTLLEHVLAGPLLGKMGDAVVVVGHDADALRPLLHRYNVRSVPNPDPDRGRTSSIQVGLRALPEHIRAVFVQGVDCPLIRPETYLALASALGACDVVVPRFQGKNGHPPLISARVVSKILAAGSDVALRDFFHMSGINRCHCDVDDPGVLLNLDRPEDLERLRDLAAGPQRQQPVD